LKPPFVKPSVHLRGDDDVGDVVGFEAGGQAGGVEAAGHEDGGFRGTSVELYESVAHERLITLHG
jgi:hypothetical protein